MVLELILPILVDLITDPVKNYVVAPIKRHISYAFKCDSKVQHLQDEVVQLRNKKDRLQQSVADARRNGEEIFENVTKWLSVVEDDIEEAERLIQGKEEATKKCFVGLCPNLKTRYLLSKKAEKKILAIDKLHHEQGLESISFRNPLQQIVEPSVYRREALSSRVLMLNQIMDALQDPKLKMIGVYGMGGVGKTTLAKEVLRKAVEEKLFETAVLVAVSQTPEIRRIQAEIADFLGLKFDVEEIPGRASVLYGRLKKSKVLIILDDVWQKFEISTVGIPCDDSAEGCKLFLTSRRKDVLSSEMGTQKEFPLEVLGEEEALSLFQATVNKTKDPKLYPVAIEIAKKCAGLPLLILIVAKELQNKELYAWVDMLKQLSVSGNEDMHERVHKVLESSFENLHGEEVKSLFLLCAMFTQSNIPIQHLLIHSMGLDLFKHVVSIEEARNRLLTLINKLKGDCLLLEGDVAGCVKMHDVVRDVAASIASRLQHAFIGAGQVRLRDWPNHDCTRIALPYCDVSDFPTGLECPKVELFSLLTEDPCLEIPDSFFEGIKKLKVLHFTGMRLVSLPSSIGLLANLYALSLHGCRLDDIVVIAELKQLELLSFAESRIVKLPREIGKLTKLKLLDLTKCEHLQVIPTNVISKLCSLEELYMRDSFFQWDTKGNASLMELENLSQLSNLEIQIVNPKLIPEGCRFFDGLQTYKIAIGDDCGWWAGYEVSRTLRLTLEEGIHLEGEIGLLLKSTEYLYLKEARGIESVLDDLYQLKHLLIQENSNIQYLIKSIMQDPNCHALPILESLCLDYLEGLENICDGSIAMESFGKLRNLTIHNCDRLTSLFSFSSSKCLPQLQELEVKDCKNLEVIVCEGSNEVTEFAQLISLVLHSLPNLKGFRKKKEGTGQMDLLADEMVCFPILTTLEVKQCKSLKYLFTPNSVVKCVMQLKKLRIEECESLEEIIGSKKDEERINKLVFPLLNNLSLSKLPSMKRFSNGYPVAFPLLTVLRMYKCNAMENFVSIIPGNKSDEYLFNELVTFTNLEKLEVSYSGNSKLWHKKFADDDSFSRLKSVSIRNCANLSAVFESNVYKRFRRLESLELSHCNGVDEIYQCQEMDLDFKEIRISLRDLRIHNLPSLKHIWSSEAFGDSTFENLQSIEVDSCKNMRYVFPAPIARGLPQLRELKIYNCDIMEVIIAKAKDDESKGGTPSSFTFPQLCILQLKKLKEMRSLYEGPHTSQWPNLKCLEVSNCDKVMNFPSSSSSYSQGNIKDKYKDIPIQQSIFFIDKFITNLEEFTIDDHSLKAMHQSGTFSMGFFPKLKKVTLASLEEESIPYLRGFLRQVYSLEMLVLSSGSKAEKIFLCVSLEELFSLDLQVNEVKHSKLKHLHLNDVDNLKHILKKDFQNNPISQYLQTLDVRNCDELINITPSSASFQNLTSLHVDGCRNMKNLVTTSTATSMMQLKEMEVIGCRMVEEIVAKDGDGTEHDVIIFNKLKSLELKNLPELKSFSSDTCTFSFPFLEQVTIENCTSMKIFCSGILSTPKLRGIKHEHELQWEGNLNATVSFSLRKWVGGAFEEGRLFQNLESLVVEKDAFSEGISANQLHFLNKLGSVAVRDCDSVEAVFDLEGLSGEDADVVLLPQLHYMQLINLPMLSQLCNKAPMGILEFNKLQYIEIENCSRLKYVFTWSVASCLFDLQVIVASNCEILESIIKEDNERDAGQITTLGSLNSVFLTNLPKFSEFYSGRGDLKCPSLKGFLMKECPNTKAFISRFTGEHKLQHNIHSTPEEFGSELEELVLDIKSVSAILKFEMPTNSFPKAHTLLLSHCAATTNSHVPLLHFLSKLPNLDVLEVSYSSLPELFKFQELNIDLDMTRTLPHVKHLRLNNLDELKQIWWQNSQFHAPLFQSLETLELRSCGQIISLAPPAASFRNLTTLKVYQCNGLKNLITASVATSMVQLKTLSVGSCEMLIVIVANENNRNEDEIVFANLQMLELSDLQNLKSFSLGHHTFKFPCLDQVILEKCPNLRTFCLGTTMAPLLHCVKDSQYGGHCYWKGSLNTTTEQLYMEKVGFKDPTDLKLSKFPILKEKWVAELPFEYFHSLERLVVDDCALFTSAISSHLLQYLKCLKVLIVEKCDSLEQVFNLEGLDVDECRTKHMPNLHELQLIDLPSLTHVWSKDPLQILSYKNLQLLKVHDCGNLTRILNLSMAWSLRNLRHLEVKNCSAVKHIIVKEEETMQECQTIFPFLESMNLQYLTNLLSFYSSTGFLECPALKIIEVIECPNLELFASEFSNGAGSCMIVDEKKELIRNDDVVSVPAFLGNKLAVPKLAELKVEWMNLKDKLNGNCRSELLSRLNVMELTGCQGEYGVLPCNFLHHFPRVEKLALSNALVEEISLHELRFLNDEHPESPVSLTKLKLSNLPRLKHLVHGDSQLVPLFQNLEDLEMLGCCRLKILAPPVVSFPNLTNLNVSNCNGLINLLTVSTARSLVQLRRLDVKKCKMMQEILAIVNDEDECHVRFSELQYLALDDLQSLTSFCSGNYEFHFPSLEEVIVMGCPNMRRFSEQAPITPKLGKVKTGRQGYDWEWEGSLNNTIQALFMNKLHQR